MGAQTSWQPHVGWLDMDYTSEPHLIGDRWRLVYNMHNVNGKMVQVPRLHEVSPVSGAGALQVIAHLPTSYQNYGAWVAVTPTKCIRLVPKGVHVDLGYLVSGPRISSCVYNGRLFFTSPTNRLRYTDGALMREVWAHLHTHTKASSDTRGPFQTEDGGDVGASFTWTSGTRYRVYVDSVVPFAKDDEVTWTSASATPVVVVGRVVKAGDKYLVVTATATQAGVPNGASDLRATIAVTWRNVPSARYVVTFFDHVVLGAPTDNIDVVRWSHLYDFGRWDEDSDSEADSYTCTEYQRNDAYVRGVTGLVQWKNMCLVFTADAIYMLRYTGLPRVVRGDPLVTGFGNGLLYAVAELDDSQAFVDMRHEDFIALRGGRLEPFGHGIRDYFFNDLHADWEQRQLTYSFVDRRFGEVGWVYVSVDGSPGVYDKAVVFNYGTRTWSVRTIANLHGFSLGGRRAKACSEVTGTCDQYVQSVQVVGASSDSEVALYGANSSLVGEAGASVPDGELLAQDTPELQSGDITYGTSQEVKSVSAVGLHSNASTDVALSARKYVDSAVTFGGGGTWSESLTTEHLTFTPVADKLIRYRFRPSASVSRGWRFAGFEAKVTGARGER